MLNDPGEIGALLQGTPLAGKPVSEGPHGMVCITGVEADAALPAWRTARAALAQTQRWPVLIAADYPSYPTGDDPDELSALDRAARSIDPWPIGRCWQDEPVDPEEIDYRIPDFPGFDLKTQIRAQLTSYTEWGIDRWVYDRMLDDLTLLAFGHEWAKHTAGLDTWHPMRAVELVLLPTPHPHLAAGWVGWFEVDPPVLAAMLYQWHQRWGAELVASWGTMLQFVVSGRPKLGDEAWDLARQHKSFASHQEADHWELALALTRSDTWFLHRRP